MATSHIPPDTTFAGYESEFAAANARRSYIGREPLMLAPSAQLFFPEGDASRLNNALRHLTQRLTVDQFAFECLGVHKYLQPHIADYLRTKPILTIGYVRIGNEPIFHFSDDDLKTWAREGVGDMSAVDLHAWLTLPSYEILDYTLGASLYRVTRDKRLLGGMTAMHHSMLRGMTYHPMILGEDVPSRIGAEITVIDLR